ncbi:MAG: class I tRNA ligase family protein, partial [Terriglobales bacterium]
NIHDWCISRQLWWGHRIPAWHCDACANMVVAREVPSSCPGCGGPLRQETDVLDTWFSSGLWPFSTLGWPDDTADLHDFYPTSLLVTGFDILFFWVARMMMLGVHFTGKAPFRQVYIHALVRDAERQKMSKTKGNVIDPLVVTEKYGTDAVRFTLAAMAAPGTDIALAEERMQGYASFANKIWNAARFIFLSANQAGVTAPAGSPPTLIAEGDHWVDRWIFTRLNDVAADMDRSLTAYRFHEAADALFHFFWHEFCDWYLEITKLRLRSDSSQSIAAVNLLAAFDGALRLLHPVMPFLTEELWMALHAPAPPAASIALAPFPQAAVEATDNSAKQVATSLQAIVTEGRKQMAETGGKIDNLNWSGADTHVPWDYVKAFLHLNHEAITGTRGSEPFTFSFVLRADAAAQKQRLEKDLAELQAQIAQKQTLLANPKFVERANPAIVAAERAKLRELELLLAAYSARLNSAS